MTAYLKSIQEAADQVGVDFQTACVLHDRLCHDESPGAVFAAVSVTRAIELYAQADQIMRLLGSLAHSEAT